MSVSIKCINYRYRQKSKLLNSIRLHIVAVNANYYILN